MRQLVILVLVAFLAVSAARPKTPKHHKPGEPAAKIFEFLDTKKEGKVSVAEIKSKIQKILPLSDDKTIDGDNDGFVTFPEFKKFYVRQYKEWRSNNLKKKN